jgi:hypothetical protein
MHTFQSCLLASQMGLLLLGACQQPVVGTICDLGTRASPSETVLATPSLDCESRQCLKVPNQVGGNDIRPLAPTEGMCTAACEADADCEAEAGTACKTGFSCGIPTGLTVGALCCQKVCVCRDYVALTDDGNMPIPEGCNAENPAATCCNLEGRRGDADYPQCQ